MAREEGMETLVMAYREDVAKLCKYLPYFETKRAKDVESQYQADATGGHTVAFPVYDATLMRFVQEASETVLMNDNYVYTYSKHGLKTVQDELAFIERATIKEIEALGDILSKYVKVGMYKSRMWTEAVDNHIFVEVLLKLKYLIEFWDKPLA